MNSVPLSNILSRDDNNFDLVRLLAAASVIVSHAFAIVHGATEAEPLASVSAFTLGQHGVNVFFLLSGLLVAASLERSRDLISFAAGRMLRIFPGLVVCVLLVAFVLGPLVTSLDLAGYFVSPATWSYVAATASLSTGQAPLPGVFDTLPFAGEVNVPLWTLKYEVMAYGLLGALAALGVWSRPAPFWLFLGALILTHQYRLGLRSVEDHAMLDHMLRFFVCFFLGAAAWRLRDKLRLSLPGAVVAALVLVATRETSFELIAGYAAIFYLVLCFAALPLASLRRLTARGDISYGLYIYGWPVAQAVLLAFPGIGAMGVAATSLSITALLAGLSWFLIEQPALSLRRHVLPGEERIRSLISAKLPVHIKF